MQKSFFSIRNIFKTSMTENYHRPSEMWTWLSVTGWFCGCWLLHSKWLPLKRICPKMSIMRVPPSGLSVLVRDWERVLSCTTGTISVSARRRQGRQPGTFTCTPGRQEIFHHRCPLPACLAVTGFKWAEGRDGVSLKRAAAGGERGCCVERRVNLKPLYSKPVSNVFLFPKGAALHGWLCKECSSYEEKRNMGLAKNFSSLYFYVEKQSDTMGCRLLWLCLKSLFQWLLLHCVIGERSAHWHWQH